jgi:hypothetical protein
MTGEQIIEAVEKETGQRIEKHNLKQWAAKGLLPHPAPRGRGRAKGRDFHYQDGTEKQIIEIINLREKYNSLDRILIELWVNGMTIDFVKFKQLLLRSIPLINKFAEEIKDFGVNPDTAKKFKIQISPRKTTTQFDALLMDIMFTTMSEVSDLGLDNDPLYEDKHSHELGEPSKESVLRYLTGITKDNPIISDSPVDIDKISVRNVMYEMEMLWTPSNISDTLSNLTDEQLRNVRPDVYLWIEFITFASHHVPTYPLRQFYSISRKLWSSSNVNGQLCVLGMMISAFLHNNDNRLLHKLYEVDKRSPI